MSLSLLFLLVGCGLEDIDAKYADTGGAAAVDPDPVDDGDETSGGAEDGGDETAGATTGGVGTGGAGTGGATTGGSGTGEATTGGDSETGGTDGGDASGAGGTSGGSTGPCAGSEVEDCSGACAPSEDLLRIGDGVCDTVYPNLNCYTYAYDGGDCEEDPEPEPGESTGGSGMEYPVEPGGDCERFDGTVGVYDCDATDCRPTWWLGDGACDDSLDMACEETGWDGGDCDPAGEDDGVCYDVEYAEERYVVDPSDSTLYGDDFAPDCGTLSSANDVGYLWSPAETRNYCIRAKSIEETTAIAPVVSVWSEDCVTQLHCEAGSTADAAPSAMVSAEFTAGVTYVVSLEHKVSYSSGFFQVQIDACAPLTD